MPPPPSTYEKDWEEEGLIQARNAKRKWLGIPPPPSKPRERKHHHISREGGDSEDEAQRAMGYDSDSEPMRRHKDFENEPNLVYLAQKLNDHGIDYCVVGAAAMIRFGSGRSRSTYLHVFMAPEGLATFKRKLVGKSYRKHRSGGADKSKFVDNRGVKLTVSLTTDPGWLAMCGGKSPKEISHNFEVLQESVRFLDLQHLLALKMYHYTRKDTARRRDLAEVRELIKRQGLTLKYAESIHPAVRDRFKREVRFATEEFVEEIHDMFWTPRDTEMKILYLLATF